MANINGSEYLPCRHLGLGGGWGDDGCLGGSVLLGTGGGRAGNCAGTTKPFKPGGGAGGGTPGGRAGGGYDGGPPVGVTEPGSGLGGWRLSGSARAPPTGSRFAPLRFSPAATYENTHRTE
ncbi:uncharacterized protein LOC135267113 [Tribolium castaneum]|uniref:uncharacterized protein LOC135267113 n=1 Tax=Tribolium castaneum TaxID=7070 RepID=UPI0030FEDD27